jgi:hypothetical protein
MSIEVNEKECAQSLAAVARARAMIIAVTSVKRDAQKPTVVVDIRNVERTLDAERHEIQGGNHAICKQN